MGGHSVPRLAAMWVSCLLILAANLSLVAALLCARAHLLSQRQNVFILGLALADLAVGLSLPAQAYRGRIDLIFADEDARRRLCMVTTALEATTIYASTFLLVGLGLDRLAIVRRLARLDTSGPPRPGLLWLAVLLCWLMALLAASPLLLSPEGWDTRTRAATYCWTRCNLPHSSATWTLYTTVTAFLLPGAVILVAYTAIVLLLYCGRSSGGVERRITVVVGVVTVCYFLCTAPFALVFASRLWGSEWHQDARVVNAVGSLLHANSLVNPLLYMHINPDIRAQVWRCLGRNRSDSETSNQRFNTNTSEC